MNETNDKNRALEIISPGTHANINKSTALDIISGKESATVSSNSEFARQSLVDFKNSITQFTEKLDSISDPKALASFHQTGAVAETRKKLNRIRPYITPESYKKLAADIDDIGKELAKNYTEVKGKTFLARKNALLNDTKTVFYELSDSFIAKPVATVLDIVGVPDDNSVKKYFTDWSEQTEKVRQQEAESDYYLSTAERYFGEGYKMVLKTLPYLVAAKLSGGASLATTAKQLSANAAANTAWQSVITAGKTAATNMLRDPSFWVSFIPSSAEAYTNAKETGANLGTRLLAGVANGILNAAIETGAGAGNSGMQSFFVNAMKEGGEKTTGKLAMQFFASIGMEGLEEVEQNVASRMVAKATYDRSAPVVSLQDESAILNPLRELKSFLGGVAVSGMLMAPTALKMDKALQYNAYMKKTQTNNPIGSNAANLDNIIPLETADGKGYNELNGTTGGRYQLRTADADNDVDFDALDRYDSRTYANRGWVVVNRVLTGNEQSRLYSQWGSVENNQFQYPRTPSGETIITVGHGVNDANKLVYISGTNQNPVISKVVEIHPTMPGDTSAIREMLIEGDNNGDVHTRAIIEGAFGQAVLVEKLPGDYAGYRELQEQRTKRASHPTGNGNYPERSAGGRSNAPDFAPNSGAVTPDSIPTNNLPTANADGTGSVSATQKPQFPTITEDPTLTKKQRKEKIQADLRASAEQFGIDKGVTEDIAYIAGRTGTHVLFVESVTTPNGTPANGMYDPAQNLIVISKDCQHPVYEVIKHEMAHSIAGTKLFNDIVEFVKESPQIKEKLDQNGMYFEDLVQGEIERMQEAGEDLGKNPYARATEEIVAKYIEKHFFSNQQTVMELLKKRQNVFYKFLYDIRNWIKNITSKSDAQLLRNVELLYVRALEQKGKQYYKSRFTETSAKPAGGKYSISDNAGVKDDDIARVERNNNAQTSEIFEDKVYNEDTNRKGSVIHGEQKAETRDAFYRRTNEEKLEIKKRGKIAFAFERTRPSAYKENSRQVQEELTKLGVPCVIVDRREINKDGMTTAFESEATTVRRDAVYINNYASIDSKEVAGHEAFHFWALDERTTAFVDVLQYNIDHSSAKLNEFWREIQEDYFGGDVEIYGENWDVLLEELYAHIVGRIHAGDLDNTVHQFLYDFDAVKSAWDSLINSKTANNNASQHSNQNSDNRFSVGTTDDFEAYLNELVESYGKHKEGANPARAVEIPLSTDGENRVSASVRSIAESERIPDDMAWGLTEQLLEEAGVFKPTSNRAQLSFAHSKIDTLGYEGALNYWRSKQNPDGSAGGDIKALGAELMSMAAERGDANAVTELAVGFVLDNRNAAQSLQASIILKQASPEGKVYVLQKIVEQLNAQNAKKKKKAKTWDAADSLRRRIDRAKQNGMEQSVIEGLLDDLNKTDGSIYLPQSAVENILNQTTPEGLEAAYKDALRIIAEQKPATWQQKWNQWRYLAMLANPSTHIRNISSNVFFAPIVQTKNLIKFALESALHNHLDHRTTSLGNHFVVQKQYRDFVNRYFEEDKEFLHNGKFNPSSFIAEHQTIFNTKFYEWLRKTNGALLEGGDNPWLKFHYTRAMAQYLAGNDVDVEDIDTNTLGQARAYAVQEALKATFRDESIVANMLQEWSNNNPYLNVLVESIVPFKKTPVNVTRRAMEYSPIGFVEAALDMRKLRQGDQDVTLNDVLDKVASGLTGSMLMGLGALLAHLGVIRGRASDNEKEEDWWELLGEQAYSINIGDGTFTIDWMAPSVLPLFVGVEIFNTLANEEGMSIGEVLESLTRITDPVIELSMMQGIQTMIKSMGYSGNVFSILGSAATSYASQALPTIGGKIANVIDGTRRENYVEKGATFSGLQYTAQRAMGKIPGLSSLRKEYVNQWGETEETENVFERIFNAVSPGYYKKNRSETVDNEITRLYQATKESQVLPSTGTKEFSYGGKVYTMTSQENTEYMKKRGSSSYNMLKKLTSSSAYKTMDDEQRVYAVKKVYDYAAEYAKKTVVTGRGDTYQMEASTEKINSAISDGGDIADYLLFSYWNGHTSADKTSNGKTISGSKKRKIVQAARDAGYTQKEINRYMKILGYSSGGYY